jgi:hypothetical protein
MTLDLNRLDEILESQKSQPDPIGDILEKTFGKGEAPQAPEPDQGASWGAHAERAGKAIGEAAIQIPTEIAVGAWNVGADMGAWVSEKLGGRERVSPLEAKSLEFEGLKQRLAKIDEVDSRYKLALEKSGGNGRSGVEMFGALVKGEESIADQMREVADRPWERERLEALRDLGVDPQSADYTRKELDSRIRSMQAELEGMAKNPEAKKPQAITRVDLPERVGRSIFNRVAARVSAVATGSTDQAALAEIEQRDLEAANDPKLARTERLAQGAAEIASFVAGPGGAVVKGMQGPTLRLFRSLGLKGGSGAARWSRGFLGESAALGAGIAGESYLRRQDPGEAAQAALLAPAYRLVGVLGEKTARSLSKVLKPRLAQAGRMGAEGVAFEVLPGAWRMALQQAGVAPQDLHGHAGLLSAGLRWWTAETDEEREQALVDLEEAGLAAGVNALTMGGLGALMPSQVPAYRRQEPELFAEAKLERAKRDYRGERSESATPSLERFARTSAELKGGRVHRPGWEPFEIDTVKGRLRVRTHKGETLTGTEAKGYLDAQELGYLLADVQTRKLLNIEGARETAREGVVALPDGSELTIGPKGQTLRRAKQGEAWEAYEASIEATPTVSQVEADFLRRFGESLKKSVPSEEGVLLDEVLRWAKAARHDDPARQEFFNAVSRVESMQLAAENPAAFVRELAGMIRGGTERSLAERIVERDGVPLEEIALADLELMPMRKLAATYRAFGGELPVDARATKPGMIDEIQKLRGVAVRNAIRAGEKVPEPVLREHPEIIEELRKVDPKALHFVNPEVLKIAGIADDLVNAVTNTAATEIEAFARRSLEDWIGERDWTGHKTIRDAKRLKKKLDSEGRGKKDAEDLTFWLEKTGNPYVKGDSFEALEKRLSPAAREVGRELRKRYDELHRMMNDSEFIDQLNYVENYVPHLWEGPKGVKVFFSGLRRHAKKNPHTKKRSIPTIHEGVTKHGLKPRTVDVVDLTRYYEGIVRTVEANQMLLRSLFKDEIDDSGLKLIMPSGEAPENYVKIGQHPLLEKTYARISKKKGKKPSADVVRQEFEVHPDVRNLLHTVLFQPQNGMLAGSVRTLNALSKQIQLSASFFHPWALAESAFANGAIEASKPWTIYTSVTKGMKMMDGPVAERAIKSGLHLGGSTDAQRGIVDRFLDNLADATAPVPGVAQATKALGKVKKGWDAWLWEKLHPSWKLLTWQKIVTENTKRYASELNDGSITMRDIERQAASFTNDAYGGQHWDLYFRLKPQDLQAVHLFMLAPDWTWSNLRIAARGVSSALPFLKNTRLSGGDTTRQQAKRYWVRMLGMMYLGTQFAQFVIDQAFMPEEQREELRRQGRGPGIWDNPPGMQGAYVRMPGKDAQGREIFAGVGKQAKETVRWLTHFGHNLGSKMAPWPRAIAKQLADHDLGSGFPAEWLKVEPEDETRERIKALVKDTLLPFSLAGNNVAMTLPQKSGMTGFRARELLTGHLNEWASEGEITDFHTEVLRVGIKDVLDAAQRNNLDELDVFRKSLSEARSRWYKRLYSALNDDDDEGLELALRSLGRLSAFPSVVYGSMRRRFERDVEKGERSKDGQREFLDNVAEALRRIDLRLGDPVRSQLRELEGRRFSLPEEQPR